MAVAVNLYQTVLALPLATRPAAPTVHEGVGSAWPPVSVVARIEFTVLVKGAELASIALLKSSFGGAALAKSKLKVSVPPGPVLLASVTIRKYVVPLVTGNPMRDGAGEVVPTFPLAQAPGTATRLPGVPVQADRIVTYRPNLVSATTLPVAGATNLNHTLRATLFDAHETAGSFTAVLGVACVVSSVNRKGVALTVVAKLMLSLVAEGACATTSVLGSEGVPPGLGDVTVMAREPAETMSGAGMEARSCVELTKVVSRALPFTLTTALDAKPPPFTVKVNAGPPVATIDGEIDVI